MIKDKAQRRYYHSKHGKEVRNKYAKLHPDYSKEWSKHKKDVHRRYILKLRGTPKGRWVRFKSNLTARRHGINITFEQYLQFWQKPCSYCGSEIKTIGLDRVDSKKGYNMDNIVSCCIRCNMAKNNIPVEEFYLWIKQLVKFQNNLNSGE